MVPAKKRSPSKLTSRGLARLARDLAGLDLEPEAAVALLSRLDALREGLHELAPLVDVDVEPWLKVDVEEP